MKVQIITNLYPLPWEPNRAAFNRQQFRNLSARCKVRITVLIGWLAGAGKGRLAKSDQAANPAVSYLRYFYLPGVARFSHALTLVFSLLLERKSIRQFGADCVLVSWAFPDGVAGVIVAKSLGLPVVIKVHGSDINLHLKHKLRALQICWAMNKAAAVITVSNALAEQLVTAGVAKNKISTIYNGVDRELFRPGVAASMKEELAIPADKQLIVFIGNLKKEKGCVDLMRAFVNIARHAENLDLVFIGVGVEQETLLGIAKSGQLEDRVFFLGSLQHHDLSRWITASSLVALPSYNEGVPNVLLEAMSCGRPVVATDVGGIPEVVGPEAGILVESGNIEDLGKALLEGLAKTWNSERISQSVAHLSWEQNTIEIHDLLNRVARSKSQ